MSQRRDLDLAPFRALRYDDRRVGDLAAVTSMPYDMVDADATAALRRTPHNVVNLILPPDADTAASAAHLLHEWRSSGVLRQEPAPALYVYEQRGADDRTLQRGLLGALALRSPDEGVVLPHEDVMPGPVAGRLALLRACQANLEPLLLSYDGPGGPARSLLEAAVEEDPILRTTTADGIRHTFWAISDPDHIAAVRRDLRDRQALICDGHHRYAAALRLQQEQHAAGHGSGPWDHVMALLVDEGAYPMEITAIHRVVDDLKLATVESRASAPPEVDGVPAASILPQGFETERFGADGARAEAAFDQPHSLVHVLITDGDEWALIRGPVAHPLSHDPYDRTLLDEELLRVRLGIPEEQVRYVHSWEHAVRAAVEARGVAFLLQPVDVATVLDRARQGRLMPRKSTSFGPKLRTGLIMRAFDA